MDITLNAGAPLGEELYSLFGRLAKDARDSADRYPDKDPSGVHTARKCVKRLRALLRTMDTPNLSSSRRALNSELRKAGNLLNKERDNEVLVEFFLHLKDSVSKGRSPVIERALRKILRSRTSILIEAPTEENFRATRKKFKRIIDDVDCRFSKLPLKKLEWEQLENALTHGKKRMMKSGRSYKENADDYTLHEWRKRIKDHFYQQLILKNRLGISDEAITKTKEVETILGIAQDCDLAIESLARLEHINLTPTEQRSLTKSIQRRQTNSLAKLDPAA